MPAPAHTRITWSGVFGSAAAPTEIWQFSLNMGESVFADEAARVATAGAMKNAFQTHLAPRIHPIAVLTRTRVAQIDAAGLVLRDAEGAYLQGDDETTVAGTGTGNTLPLQTALCISLVTPRPGPTGKGRFFLPAPAVTLGTDTRLSTVQQTAFKDSAVAFIKAVDAAYAGALEQGEPAGDVVVASSKGYLSKVNGVRVGRVLDTQRRRRGDLAEEYLTEVFLDSSVR